MKILLPVLIRIAVWELAVLCLSIVLKAPAAWTALLMITFAAGLIAGEIKSWNPGARFRIKPFAVEFLITLVLSLGLFFGNRFLLPLLSLSPLVFISLSPLFPWIPWCVFLLRLWTRLCNRFAVLCVLEVLVLWWICLLPLWSGREGAGSPRWLVDHWVRQGLNPAGQFEVISRVLAMTVSSLLLVQALKAEPILHKLRALGGFFLFFLLTIVLWLWTPPVPLVMPPPEIPPQLFSPPPPPPEPEPVFLGVFLNSYVPSSRLSAYFFRGPIAGQEASAPETEGSEPERIWENILDEARARLQTPQRQRGLFRMDLFYFQENAISFLPQSVRLYEKADNRNPRHVASVRTHFQGLTDFDDLDFSFGSPADLLPAGFFEETSIRVQAEDKDTATWMDVAGINKNQNRLQQLQALLKWTTDAWNYDALAEFDGENILGHLSALGPGNDQHFAKALGQALQELGIPHQQVHGFRVDLAEGTFRDEILVTEAHRSEWVEIFWGESGWIPLLLPQQRSPVEEEEPRHDEVQQERLQSLAEIQGPSDQSQEQVRFWWVAVGLGLLFLAGVKLRILIAAYGLNSRPDWERRQFLRMLEILSMSGWTREYGESRRDFIARIGNESPQLTQPVMAITKRYIQSLSRDPPFSGSGFHGLKDLLTLETRLFHRVKWKGIRPTSRRLDTPQNPLNLKREPS